MGYCVDQRSYDFFISKDKFNLVVDEIHKLSKSKHYSWVNNNFSEVNDIKDIFKCWRWHIDFDDGENICDIYFEGQKLGDDETLFRAIAPFVKDGSYIEMSGEDGALWRWAFKNGQCREVYATITWDY